MKGCTQRQGWQFKGIFCPSCCCSFWPQERRGWTGCLALMSMSKQSGPPGPMVVFSKRWRGSEGMDSDKVHSKTCLGADEHDRAPAPMDFFCGHWNKRRRSVQKSSNKGPLWPTRVTITARFRPSNNRMSFYKKRNLYKYFVKICFLLKRKLKWENKKIYVHNDLYKDKTDHINASWQQEISGISFLFPICTLLS